jgi:hypothetical protein
VLRVRKGFQQTLLVLISHENYWWPHLRIAVLISHVVKHSNIKEKEWTLLMYPELPLHKLKR